MMPSFWRGRRVLLTGHTGFKGAWLALWLERLGARVTALALAPETEPNLFELLSPWPALESRIGDLRDPRAVEAAVEAADPEIVLHLAAQALVRRSYREPVETFAVNVMGTAHLLEALRGRAALKAVLVVTSDKAYGNQEKGRPFKEDDPLGGSDPYSASKAAAEIAVAAWAESYFAPDGIVVATARSGNVIGGGDWAGERLVPDIWRAVSKGLPLELRSPEATRPWQHVLDPLSGYLLYLERLAESEPGEVPSALNFGPAPGPSLTVARLAERMLAALDGPAAWRPAEGPQPPERHNLALDPALAEGALGWRAKLSQEDAIGWTADWYRALAGDADQRAFTLDQIARFEAL